MYVSNLNVDLPEDAKRRLRMKVAFLTNSKNRYYDR